MSAILDAALESLALDIYPVPIKTGTKEPPMTGWTNLRLTVDDLPSYFSNGNQIGWLLGIPPFPVADVDFDCQEALDVARHFNLPKTSRIFGRKSKPASHRLYELPEEFSSTKFKDPVLVKQKHEHPVIIELRGKGGQTVVPPSFHPLGEQVRWEQEGEFGKTTHAELRAWVAKIAAAALLIRYWPKGHETRQALAGMLARAGWPEKDTAEFVCAVLRVTQPERPRKLAPMCTVATNGWNAAKISSGGQSWSNCSANTGR